MLHIYTGDGKGKTCMAMGQALRCAGWGKKVAIFSFLKPGISGELKVFQKMENVSVYQFEKPHDFYYKLEAEEKGQLQSEILREYEKALQLITDHEVDLIVLDELIDVIDLGLLSKQQAIDLIANHDKIEIVVTGHVDQYQLSQFADYHSVVCMKQHPYQKGITARKGIEY